MRGEHLAHAPAGDGFERRGHLVQAEEEDREALERAFNCVQQDKTLRFVSEGSALLDYLERVPGVDRIASPWPDLIVLDLYMPGITGLELLAEFSRREWLRRFSVVVLTAHTDPQILRSVRDTGVGIILQKPNNDEGLISLADSLVDLASRMPDTLRSASGE